MSLHSCRFRAVASSMLLLCCADVQATKPENPSVHLPCHGGRMTQDQCNSACGVEPRDDGFECMSYARSIDNSSCCCKKPSSLATGFDRVKPHFRSSKIL